MRSAATDIYVTCCVVGSALLAYLMIKYHQHVLFARSGALQYTKLGSESSRPPAGTALQPLLCEYFRSCDGLPIEQHLALTTESSCALARLRADAFVCGAAGGYTNLFLKGVAELVKNLIEGALTMTLLGDCRLKEGARDALRIVGTDMWCSARCIRMCRGRHGMGQTRGVLFYSSCISMRSRPSHMD